MTDLHRQGRRRRIPLSLLAITTLLGSLMASAAFADGGPLQFQQEQFYGLTAAEIADAGISNEDDCGNEEGEVGWHFVAPGGHFDTVDITYSTGLQQYPGDETATQTAGKDGSVKGVFFATSFDATLDLAEAFGTASQNKFVLSHVCVPDSGFLQVEKFIDVDADGVLDPEDVTSGDPNLAGWQFNVYEGTDTTGTLVDTLTTDGDGQTETIELGVGTYTVEEANTGKTITTAVTGGSTTELTTDGDGVLDNSSTKAVVANETTTFTFGNACLITKVFELTGVPDGTTGLVARYDTDLDSEVSGTDVVTVALSDEGGGVHSGTAPDLFQIGDDLEWEYADTGTDSSEFVGSETFVLADGYPNCLRTNTVEFAPPTLTVNKFKDILADGLTGDDTQGLADWDFQLFRDGGDGVFGGDDTLIETLTTDAAGSATNTVDLAPGLYHVLEVEQANWTNTTPGTDPPVISVTLDISEDETVNFANAPEARFDVRFFDLTGSTDATIDCDTAGTDSHDETASPETTFESDNVLVGEYNCTITITDP